VVGCGTVGRALLRALLDRTEGPLLRVVSLTRRSGTLHSQNGLDPAAALAALDRGSFRIPGVDFHRWDGATAAAQVSADLVVDLATSDLRSAQPETETLLSALEAGRDVVTASKAALCRFPRQVTDLMARTGAHLRCSASVAGGVPLLEVIEGALRGSVIEEVAGAWNATSGFVLSLVEEGATPEEALEEARRLGFAEEDASSDLDGSDAAAKACIVARAAFGMHLTLDDVPRLGLDAATFAGVREAARRGRRTRVVARVTRQSASVAVERLPEDHPLATLPGEAAVSIRTTHSGIVSLRGPGAGGAVTAAAVLSDVLHFAGARAPDSFVHA
jgi:homoserine dehydrogenase